MSKEEDYIFGPKKDGLFGPSKNPKPLLEVGEEGGFQKGQLNVVVAETRTGKTLFGSRVPDDPSTEYDESRMTETERQFLKDSSSVTGVTNETPSTESRTEELANRIKKASTESEVESLTDDEYRRAKLQLLQEQNNALNGLTVVCGCIVVALCAMLLFNIIS